MYGPPSTSGSRIPNDPNDWGVVPRVLAQIFSYGNQRVNSEAFQLSVFCSFVQIYNENVYDMLRWETLICFENDVVLIVASIRYARHKPNLNKQLSMITSMPTNTNLFLLSEMHQ
jgi:hypothetical protein